MENTQKTSKASFRAGWIITILVTLFMLMDAVMKIIKAKPAVDNSPQIGWPIDLLQPVGMVLLISTLLYVIPRTCVLGAILLTGYLGGAVAIMLRAQAPGHPFLFPVIFGVLVWAGIFLRDARLRSLLPVRKY